MVFCLNSFQVTITDTLNDKYTMITIPVLLGELAPVFEDAVDGNITIMIPENTRRGSAIAVIRVSDPNNGITNSIRKYNLYNFYL